MSSEGVEQTADSTGVETSKTTAHEQSAETRIALPLVAIIGRPNVGKSTLFNRITGERRAITGDEPGITRDRIYGEAEWNGRPFSVVDTGGIVPDDEALIPANILKQAAFAIEEAQVIVWVVDARKGITPLDEELAQLLRSTGKRVLVAANKVDMARLEVEAGEFFRFGFDDVIPVSAEQSNGVAELLDAVVANFQPVAASEDEEQLAPRELRLAIVGRPNVGKSSLLNRLLGEERVIVSPVPGTTRDAVDTLLEWADENATADEQSAIRNPQSAIGTHRFRLIDTAGIRRKGKTEE